MSAYLWLAAAFVLAVAASRADRLRPVLCTLALTAWLLALGAAIVGHP